MNFKQLAAAAAFAAFAFNSTAVLGQDDASSAPEAPMQQQGVEVSDTELRQFMQASIEVAKIRDDYTERINNAQNQPIAQQLQEDAQDQMIKAVEMLGLDVMRYNTLAEQVQSSPELQQRLHDIQ